MLMKRLLAILPLALAANAAAASPAATPILPGYWTDVKAQVAASRAAQTPPQPQRQAQPAMRLN